jgi:hypothetical protein
MSSVDQFETCNLFTLLVAIFGLVSVSAAEAQDVPFPTNVDPNNFHPGYYAIVPDWNEIPTNILLSDDFVGVKVLYLWKTLETAPNTYDFSSIEEDLATLEAAGKRLWISIDYTQWNGNHEPYTPEYMWTDPKYGGDPEYYGNYRRGVQAGGWYPMFWNQNVKTQLLSLVKALGERFNGEAHVEGVVIGETSAEVPAGYDCSGNLEFFQSVSLTAKNSFKNKVAIQQVNFACFDLPDFMQWLANNGIGIGTPDIYVFKNFLTDTIYPLMYHYRNVVPMGPDVQWMNYERNNLSVREIRDYAIANMDPWYIFWQVRQPYFDEEVLPAVFSRPLPAAERYYSSGPLAPRPRAPVLSR